MTRDAERAIGALAVEAGIGVGAASCAPTETEEAALGRLVLHRSGVRDPRRILVWCAAAGVVVPPLAAAAVLWIAWAQRDTYRVVDTLELVSAWSRGAAASCAVSLGSLAVLARACGMRVRGTVKSAGPLTPALLRQGSGQVSRWERASAQGGDVA